MIEIFNEEQILISRSEYTEFQINEHKKNCPSLSPEDLDSWSLSLNNEFSRMKIFQKSKSPLTQLIVGKKINLIAAVSLTIISLAYLIISIGILLTWAI